MHFFLQTCFSKGKHNQQMLQICPSDMWEENIQGGGTDKCKNTEASTSLGMEVLRSGFIQDIELMTWRKVCWVREESVRKQMFYTWARGRPGCLSLKWEVCGKSEFGGGNQRSGFEHANFEMPIRHWSGRASRQSRYTEAKIRFKAMYPDKIIFCLV